jgi:cell division transport system permease protein
MSRINLHPLRYWAAQTLRGIRSSWTIQLAAVGSISVGLLLVGLVALGARNLDRLVGTVGNGLHVTAYLRPDADASRVTALTRVLQRNALVASVRRVSPEEAHRRLEASLGDRRGLLDGVEPGFLPASLELTLRQSEADQVRPILALLSASPVVEEVDYLGQWVNRLSSILALVRGLGVAIAIIICLACLYIVVSTIRLGVFARRDEIGILRLVGATERYVRAPFLLEGALQGVAGALLASGLLYVLFRVAAPPLEGLLSQTLSAARITFLSPLQLLLGAGGAVLLGLVGSRVAVARHGDREA